MVALTFFIIPVFFTFFAVLWLGIGALTARMMGWTSLARLYPAPPSMPKPLNLTTFNTGKMGMGNVKNALAVGTTNEGLFISIAVPFQITHKPMFIPWDHVIGVTMEKLFFWNAFVFYIQGEGKKVYEFKISPNSFRNPEHFASRFKELTK